MKTVRLAALIVILTAGPASAREDWQYWSSWAASHQLSDKDTLSFHGEMYAQDDMSDDYIYLMYASYTRNVGQGFSILGQGYFESVEHDTGDWTNTRSVVIGPVYRTSLGNDWSLKGQVRFFYQLAPTAQWDYYRPRLALTKKLGSVSVSIEDELRIDLAGSRETDFFRNRVFVTCLKQLTDSVSIGLGYIRQSDRIDGEWESFNALHTLVKWEL